jgi:ABC-type multidrug transport system permease subunit
MNHPLLQLFLSRLRSFYREPIALFWVYGFPLILAVGLGFAFRDRKPEPVQVDIVEAPGAAELVEHLDQANLKPTVLPLEECRQRLRTGKSALFIEPEGDSYRLVFDEARPESLAARSAADLAIVRWKAEVSPGGHDLPGGGYLMDAAVSEPGNRYIDWFMPGLMGMNIMGGGLFGVGFLIVDMRVRKLLKRLLATPMRRGDFMLSIFGGRLVMLIPEMTALFALACLIYQVPVNGNPLVLVLTLLVGTFAFAGIGVLLASRTDKIETISGLINLVMMPGWLLSGVFFSAKRFPDAVQPLIQALPLTQLNDALREVMLEGATLAQITWRLAILLAWGILGFLLAKRWFRWQ